MNIWNVFRNKIKEDNGTINIKSKEVLIETNSVTKDQLFIRERI